MRKPKSALVRLKRLRDLMELQRSEQPQRQRRKTKNRHRRRLVWSERLAALAYTGRGRDPFMARYRLNQGEFAALVGKIRARFPEWGCYSLRSRAQARRSSGLHGPVSGELQLSMLLRHLAGGSYLDIADLHGVSTGSFHSMINDTMDKILAVEEFLYDGSPIDPNFDQKTRLQQIEADGSWAKVMDGFDSTPAGRYLPGGIGAIDGWAARIVAPTFKRDGVANRKAYYNRKKFFALAVQAIADRNAIFLSCTPGNCGTSHDSICWKSSALGRYFAESGGEGGGVFVQGRRAVLFADDAYGADELKLCPKSSNGQPEIEAFNYLQSAQRIHVERSFGILVARWGILWRPLRCSLHRAQRTIACCMLLHNICLRRGDCTHATGLAMTVADGAARGDQDAQAGSSRWEEQGQCHRDRAPRRQSRARQQSELRDNFIAAIRSAGVRRGPQQARPFTGQ